MAGNFSKTKQVIIMRSDLNLSTGKLMAQASHASLSAVLNKNTSKDIKELCIPITDEESEWFNERFTKVVLSVGSEEELMKIYHSAVDAGLNVSRPIIDAGFTELDKPTLTCIAIGPNLRESIDLITGTLRVFSGTNNDKTLKKILRRLIDNHSGLVLVQSIKKIIDG